MGGIFELTFCDLRCKEIVSTLDGKKLGRIIDLVFSSCGEIRGIVAPYGRKGLFLRCQEIFIPWKCIKKIGEDIILVEINDQPPHGHKDRRSKDKHHGSYSDQYREFYVGDDKKHDHDRHSHDDCHPHSKDCEPPKHKHPHHDDCCPPRKDNCDKSHHGHDKHRPNCDRLCEKCMLFDCIHRWRNDEGIFVDNKKYDC